MGRRAGAIAALAGTFLLCAASSISTEKPALSPAVIEKELRAYEQSLLYTTGRLPENTGRRHVFVQYDAVQHLETTPFRKHEATILAGVQQIYAGHGVDIQFLRFVPIRPGIDRVVLRVMDEDRYRNTIPSSNVYVQSFTSGMADVERRIAYVKGWLTDIDFERQWTDEFVSVSIDTVAHEIAHLLGVPHNDLENVPNGKKSLMWSTDHPYAECSGVCSDFTLEEERIIHSFLDRGQMYRAYVEAGTFSKYAHLVREYRTEKERTK